MNLKLGDWVYAGDWCYGQIVAIDDDLISVEFDTGTGGGTCTFDVDDVVLADDRSNSRIPNWFQNLKNLFNNKNKEV